MVFQNDGGKNVTITIPEVKDDLTDLEVKNLMQSIIAKDIVTSVGGDLISVVGASIVSREVQDLEVR